MKKHAYMIVAFDNWQILNKQIQLLDYEYNDIYLLIDKKSKNFNFENLPLCQRSKLILIDRINIYWAEFSQVQAMINILKRAIKEEKLSDTTYSYFHFFSGVCLPIKSQKYIHDFCDNSGKEFIGIVPEELWYSIKRVKFYWLFLNNKFFHHNKFLKALAHILAFVQRISGINRLKDYNGTIYNGWDWASITHDFAVYLIERENQIKKMFDKVLCPSELWLHTLSYNSEFKDRIYDISSLRNGSMRYIDWQRGRPYVWGNDEADFKMLMDSPYLFARKFSENNMNIVNKIFDEIDRRNKNDQRTVSVEN